MQLVHCVAVKQQFHYKSNREEILRLISGNLWSQNWTCQKYCSAKGHESCCIKGDDIKNLDDSWLWEALVSGSCSCWP